MTTHVSASSSTSIRDGAGACSAAFPRDRALGPTDVSEVLWGLGRGAVPAGFAACGLDGNLRNAPQARRFVAATLDKWALPALVPDAALVVSELVTNAVQHALEPEAAGQGDYPVWLGMFLHPDDVVCAVTDPSSRPPMPRVADSRALGGRGLSLISALSASWSWSLTPPRGKTVWATLNRPAYG
ncbi:ATP-binding protein [Streptomyces sp. NPDC014894]|uniref:ATP-binding protein n=1 Tax=Streptomyces sp. NPDC014894 TaxID=3364931 RepID=UPI00370223C1